MNKTDIGSRVLVELKKHKCVGRIVSIEHLAELKDEIETAHRTGQFCKAFFEERLSYFAFLPPDNVPNARSVMIVAAPQPQILVTFVWDGRPRRYVVPPTYDEGINGSIEGLLRRILEPEGYHVAPSALPLKLLAVRSGLAAYGKNNICYVTGMGSFHRLMAFYSDAPCTQDSWRPSLMLERCARCAACVKKCPTQAIDSTRFLLRAERCLTFHNESPKDFPSWIEPRWHECIVGCMRCQSICPENKRLRHWVENGGVFSQEETALLMRGVLPEELPRRVKTQLEQLGLIEYTSLLPRNLKALIDREDKSLDEDP